MRSHPSASDRLPEPVQSRLRGYSSDGRNLRTESCSDVFLYTHPLKSGLILKTRDIRLRPQELDLLAETVALTWLQDKLPVPEYRCFHVEGDTQYLLMTQLEGVSGIHPEATGDPARLVEEFARGLRDVHALDIGSCPMDWRMSRFFQWAEELIESGALDDQLKEGEHRTILLDKLSDIKEAVPEEEDLVFTHGDYCLPNVLFKDGELTGFIDLGFAGVGDRYLDFVSASWTIQRNLGEEWISPFFHAYGLEHPDREKMGTWQSVFEFVFQ
ncbi:MAG: aminoglycoside 3'-phosphotransferase [Gemmatimonadetes bacterium]|nr:aminoglycoside 3'-phosphotransferase [Gemmatimonadota bacterium]MYD24752.1 aminoglycoside 3'-phosphotransferase [Gemmatimonadota bacterium]MYJ00332.1 aminoglycoside 3'-phosphotransferase [Gemmatimonadota bacterium]